MKGHSCSLLTCALLAPTLSAERFSINNETLRPEEITAGDIATISGWSIFKNNTADTKVWVNQNRKRHITLANGASVTQDLTIPPTPKDGNAQEKLPRAGYFGIIMVETAGLTEAGNANLQLILKKKADGATLINHSWTTDQLANPSHWSVHSASSQHNNDWRKEFSIDGRADTSWLSQSSPSPGEQWITIDLGKETQLPGLLITPRHRWNDGLMLDYKIHVGNDPLTLHQQPATHSGSFWNPQFRTAEEVKFAQPAHGRYLRVSNTSHLDSNTNIVGALAEIGILDEAIPTSSRQFIYVPNSVIDALDAQVVSLSLRNTSATPVVVSNIGFTRHNEQITTALQGKANGHAGPDEIKAGAYGFNALTVHQQPLLAVLSARADGPSSQLKQGDLITAINGKYFQSNNLNPSREWFYQSAEACLGRAIIDAYSPETPVADKGKITISVLRSSSGQLTEHHFTVQLPFSSLPGEAPTHTDSVFVNMHQDAIQHVARSQEASGKWPGNQMRTWVAALALLGTKDPQHSTSISNAAEYLFRTFPTPGNDYDSFFYQGIRALFIAEYWRASGDKRAERWLNELFSWVPTTTHMSPRGHLALGHGPTGLPYGNKALMAPLSHLIAAEALAKKYGAKGNTFATLSPFIFDSWSDPAQGGHGAMGYNFSYKDAGEFWSRSGLTALALHFSGKHSNMKNALLDFMEKRHIWMRNSHAYGEPGAALGLLALATARPDSYQELYKQWRWNYLLHWQPGHGLHYTTPHMGAPYMEGDLIMNASYAMLWSQANQGLHSTGGTPDQWLNLPSNPNRELTVSITKSPSGVITLTCDKANAEIFLTTDGTLPTKGSLKYRLPFQSQSGMKIRAKAYLSDQSGNVATFDTDHLSSEVSILSATGFTDATVAKNRASIAFDGKDSTSWITNNGDTKPSYPHEVSVDLGEPHSIQQISITQQSEATSPKTIELFTSVDGSTWNSQAEQTWTLSSYSNKETLALNSVLNSRYIKLRFTESFGEASNYMNLREIRFSAPSPQIHMDKVANLISLSGAGVGQSIRYTLDGSTPSSTSPLYSQPLPLSPDGALIQAHLFLGQQKIGQLAIATATGNNARTSYTATASSQQGGVAALAVDGDPNTIWHSQWNLSHPHHITLDLQSEKTFHGFYYIPRAGGGNGTIDQFAVYTSNDGTNFGEAIISGSFDAMGYKQNAETRIVRFHTPVSSRYLRIKSLRGINDTQWFSAAEIGPLYQPFAPRDKKDALSLDYDDWLELFDISNTSNNSEALLSYVTGVSLDAPLPILWWTESVDNQSRFTFEVQRDLRANASSSIQVSKDLVQWLSIEQAIAADWLKNTLTTHTSSQLNSNRYRAEESTPRLFFKLVATP